MSILAPLDRFTPKHRPNGDCWEWIGARHPSGYGKFFIRKVEGRVVLAYAHRWSYEHYVGPIPDGYDVDHLCRNKWCVKPTHLEAVTHRENTIRVPRPDQCGRGHEFTPENTSYRTCRGYRVRECRACNRVRNRRAYARRQSLKWTCPICGVVIQENSRRGHSRLAHPLGGAA